MAAANPVFNPRTQVSAGLYVKWSPIVQPPELTFRRMHEESVRLAAYAWFRGLVFKVVIMYVKRHSPQKHPLNRLHRHVADCTKATSYTEAMVIVRRGNAYDMHRLRVPWIKPDNVCSLAITVLTIE